MGLRASEILKRQVRDLDAKGQVLWIDLGKTHNARRHLNVPEVLQAYLLQICKCKGGKEDYIFAAHTLRKPRRRQALWEEVRTICHRAEVPAVCPLARQSVPQDFRATNFHRVSDKNRVVTLGYTEVRSGFLDGDPVKYRAAEGHRTDHGASLDVSRCNESSYAEPIAPMRTWSELTLDDSQSSALQAPVPGASQ